MQPLYLLHIPKILLPPTHPRIQLGRPHNQTPIDLPQPLDKIGNAKLMVQVLRYFFDLICRDGDDLVVFGHLREGTVGLGHHHGRERVDLALEVL